MIYNGVTETNDAVSVEEWESRAFAGYKEGLREESPAGFYIDFE